MTTYEYKLQPGAYKAKMKETLIASLALIVVVCTLYTFAYYPFDADDRKFLSTAAPVLLVVVPAAVAIQVRRQKKQFEHYTISISDNEITFHARQPTELRLPIADINLVLKNTDGSFLIRAGSKNKVYIIPAQVQGIDDLELHLNLLFPIMISTGSSFLFRYATAIILLVGTALLVFIISMNKLIIAITGPIIILTFAGVIYSFHVTDRSIGYGSKALVLPIVLIVGKMVYVLTDLFK